LAKLSRAIEWWLKENQMVKGKRTEPELTPAPAPLGNRVITHQGSQVIVVQRKARRINHEQQAVKRAEEDEALKRAGG
jgi:hypothetical protein